MSDELGANLAMEENGDTDLPQQSLPVESVLCGRRKRGRPKGVGKSKAKAKRKVADVGKNKVCFHTACSETKVTNRKFCKKHHRFAKSMKYQAQTKQELPAHNEIMSDPSKHSRRGTVSAWPALCGRATSGGAFDDYWVHKGQPSGRTREESHAQFFRAQ